MKLYFHIFYSLLCIFSVSNVNAQKQEEPKSVAIYHSKTEVPGIIKPQQKIVFELPKVVIIDNEIDLVTFRSTMNQWKQENESKIAQFEPITKEMIEKNQFDELAEFLINEGHYSINSISVKEGGHNE